MTEPIPGPAYRILTPRLCLRCWNPEDAPTIKAAVDASREHLIPWMSWAQEESSSKTRSSTCARCAPHLTWGRISRMGFSADMKARCWGAAVCTPAEGIGPA